MVEQIFLTRSRWFQLCFIHFVCVLILSTYLSTRMFYPSFYLPKKSSVNIIAEYGLSFILHHTLLGILSSLASIFPNTTEFGIKKQFVLSALTTYLIQSITTYFSKITFPYSCLSPNMPEFGITYHFTSILSIRAALKFQVRSCRLFCLNFSLRASLFTGMSVGLSGPCLWLHIRPAVVRAAPDNRRQCSINKHTKEFWNSGLS